MRPVNVMLPEQLVGLRKLVREHEAETARLAQRVEALEASQAELLVRLGNVENKFPKRGRPPRVIPGTTPNLDPGSTFSEPEELPVTSRQEAENISASELKLGLVDRIMEAAAKGNTP